MAACFLLPPPHNLTLSSPRFIIISPHSHHALSFIRSKNKSLQHKSLFITSAVTESNSSNPVNSIDEKAQSLLQELAESLVLPPDYFSQLPRDLRLDLNDAAFDLANGPVLDECGQELGGTLLNLSQAWEKADTSTSSSLASTLPSLVLSLSGNAKSSLGKRLVSSGRRFQSMGQYGQGELQRIAKAMIETGKLLSMSPVTASDEKSKEQTRMFKFGELQVKLTSDKANIGAAVSVIFGIISWQLALGVQNVPESSLQYANDNALLLGKSLRGALLAVGYGSTILSAFATVGLILLGRQLKSEEQ
ncbi:hypothetical protein ACHQM5_014307 [Ranunculus cassubicifolius]